MELQTRLFDVTQPKNLAPMYGFWGNIQRSIQLLSGKQIYALNYTGYTDYIYKIETAETVQHCASIALAVGDSWASWCACFVVHHLYIQQSARDLGVMIDSRQSVRVCCLCLTERLLSTQSTETMLVRGCHQDDGPGIHYQPPGLVQLTVLRHHWRVDATSAVGAECCGQADHWHTTMWPHLTVRASPAALASSVAACQL